MLIKIDNSKKVGNSNIQILYPGLSINDSDTGYATFGRIDQAKFAPGAFIAMHPHKIIKICWFTILPGVCRDGHLI